MRGESCCKKDAGLRGGGQEAQNKDEKAVEELVLFVEDHEGERT